MPFDGSGNYTRVHDWTDDRDANIKIQAARMDQEMDDQASAFNQTFLRSGVAAMTGNLDMGQQRVIGIGNGSAASPAIQFDTDATTGVYLAATGRVAFAANGVERMHVDTAGVAVTGTFEVSGATTLTGVATFTAVPVFSAGIGAVSGSTGAFSGNVTVGGTLGVTGQLNGSTMVLSGAATATQYNVGDSYLVKSGNDFWVVNGNGDGGDLRLFAGGQFIFDLDGDTGIAAVNTSLVVGGSAGTLVERITSYLGNFYAIRVGGSKLRLADQNNEVSVESLPVGGGSEMVLKTGTTERMRIDANGNVGIGTTGPAGYGKLAVVGGNIAVSQDGSTVLTMRANAGATNLGSFNTTGSYLAFQTTPNAGSETERMRIDSSGNVGIGTTSPQTSLHVETSGNTSIRVTSFGNSNMDLIAAASYVQIGSPNGVPLLFQTSDTERMRIDASGNVGIGTSSPGSILSVSDDGTGLGITNAAGGNFNIGLLAGVGSSLAYVYQRANAALLFGTNNVESMRIDANGNVGIGNTGPTEKLDVSGTARAENFREGTHTLTGTTPAIDPINGGIQTWTLTANSTPTDSLSDGESVLLMIDDGTAYTVTWPSVTWVGGSAPTLSATGFNVISLWKVGSTLYGSFAGNT